jgi:hypothetical protein
MTSTATGAAITTGNNNTLRTLQYLVTPSQRGTLWQIMTAAVSHRPTPIKNISPIMFSSKK